MKLDSTSTIARYLQRLCRLAIRPLPKRIVQLLFREFTVRLHEIGDDFVTVRTRPKSGAATVYAPIDPIPVPISLRWAIVIQGPLSHDQRFTLESVRYYRRNAPEAIVVVSTWEGEDESELQKIRDLGAHVVTGPKPTTPGRLNVNFQALSSQRGLEYARQMGCSHACKTRSDQRFYAIHLMPTLADAIKSFPVVGHDRPRERLVTLSRWTPKYYPLLMSDFFTFGRVEDLLEYWSPPPDETKLSRWEFDELVVGMKRVSEFNQTPEQYLFYNYLKAIGETPQWTLEYWWSAIAERFMVIDSSLLDFYWPKYLPQHESAEMLYEGDEMSKIIASGSVIRTLDWLRLYSLMKPDTNICLPETDLAIKGPAPDQLRVGEFARADRTS